MSRRRIYQCKSTVIPRSVIPLTLNGKPMKKLLLTLIILSALNAQGAVFNSFSVGNSLTGQSLQHIGDDISELAADRGVTLNWAQHLKCGSSLTNIVNNPTTVCVGPSSYGYFGAALPNNQWDAVTLEAYGDPFPDARSSTKTLIDLTRSNPANAHTKIYMLQIWPQGASSDSFATRWTRLYDPSVDDYESRWSRQYSTDLLMNVRSDNTGDIGMVPTTEVLYQLDLLARASKISAFSTVDQIYADANHLNPIGSYIARMTMMATLLDQSPVGLPLQSQTVGLLNAADTLLIQQTVWNVVSSDPATTLVPEPSCLALLVGAFSLLRRRRSR